MHSLYSTCDCQGLEINLGFCSRSPISIDSYWSACEGIFGQRGCRSVLWGLMSLTAKSQKKIFGLLHDSHPPGVRLGMTLQPLWQDAHDNPGDYSKWLEPTKTFVIFEIKRHELRVVKWMCSLCVSLYCKLYTPPHIL